MLAVANKRHICPFQSRTSAPAGDGAGVVGLELLGGPGNADGSDRGIVLHALV